jgi:protease I
MANITGKRIVMIIAPQNFRDEELIQTREELERAGGLVTVASQSTETAQGMFGAVAQPDITIDQVKIEDFDAFVFVGGSGSEVYFNNSTAQRIAKDAYAKNKIVSAICIAPSILANANLLKGKRATVWAGDKYISILKSNGAKYTGETVTQEGRNL